MEVRWRLNGDEVRAHLEFVDGVLWVHYQGRTFSVDPREKMRKSSSRFGPTVSSGDVLSPMPGKITKIMRTKGERVNRGDAVVVVEAMKMEYTLKAEVAGVIDVVDCGPGDQVFLGQVLVRIQGDPS